MTDLADFYQATETEKKLSLKRASLLERVFALEQAMACNCDLDNWEPERDTGHSCVCRIHKAAKYPPTKPGG